MTKLRLICVIAVTVGLLLVGATVAGEPELKYRFKPGEIYTYAVTVVGELGQRTDTTKGTVELTVKSASGSQMQMTPRVSLTTSTKGAAVSGKGFGPKMPSGGPPGAGGPFGKKIIAGAREITIDAHGKVLSFSGETSLPWLLGTAEEFVIEPLSDKGEKNWQREKDVLLVAGERHSGFGPPPKVARETNTSAKEVMTYEVGAAQGNLVAIKRTYDFKTANPEGTAGVHMEGISDLTFDSQAGLIKTGEFKGTITVTDKNITFKIPVTASFRLMDTAEAAALKKQQDEARQKAIDAATKAAASRPATLPTRTRPLTVGKKTTGGINAVEKSVNFTVTLTKGKTYVIDMMSTNATRLDPVVQVLDSKGKELAKDDDGGENRNARLVFTAPETATYVIVATSFGAGNGVFTLEIKQAE